VAVDQDFEGMLRKEASKGDQKGNQEWGKKGEGQKRKGGRQGSPRIRWGHCVKLPSEGQLARQKVEGWYAQCQK
jgi:hypothetical protein